MSFPGPGPGRPRGADDQGIAAARAHAHRGEKESAAQSARARNPRGRHFDPEALDLIGDARSRGAKALPQVIDVMVRMATTGYVTYRPVDAEPFTITVSPETIILASRFVADRCGMPVRQETELSGAVEGLPLTIIVTGDEGAK